MPLTFETLHSHELRQSGLVQIICASTLISSAMSTDSRAHALLRPDADSSAMASDQSTVSSVEMRRAHQLVLGTLESLLSLMVDANGGGAASGGGGLGSSQGRGGGSSLGFSGVSRAGAAESGVGGDDFMGTCAESLMRFVWCNREAIKTILDAPLVLRPVRAAEDAVANGCESTLPADGADSFRIVPFKKAASERMSDVSVGLSGKAREDSDHRVILEEHLRKEQALLLKIMEIIAHSGALDLRVPPPGPDSHQVNQHILMWLARDASSPQLPLAHRLLKTARERLQARMDRALMADKEEDEELWLSLERALSLLVQRTEKGEVLFDGAGLRAQLTGAPQIANAPFGGQRLGAFSRELMASSTDRGMGGDAESELSQQLAEFVAAALEFLCGESSPRDIPTYIPTNIPTAFDHAGDAGGSEMGGAWRALVETSANLSKAEADYDQVARTFAMDSLVVSELERIRGEMIEVRRKKAFSISEREQNQNNLHDLKRKEEAKVAELKNKEALEREKIARVTVLRDRQTLLRRDVERVSQIAQNCLTLLVCHCCAPQPSASSGWGAGGSRPGAAGRGGTRLRLWSAADGSGLAQRLEKVNNSVRGQHAHHVG